MGERKCVVQSLFSRPCSCLGCSVCAFGDSAIIGIISSYMNHSSFAGKFSRHHQCVRPYLIRFARFSVLPLTRVGADGTISSPVALTPAIRPPNLCLVPS